MSQKILLISDPHHFSTKDMFDGYCEAFKHLNVCYDTIPIHQLINPKQVAMFSLEGAYGIALAKLLNKRNQYTHCLVISGLTLPEWFIESMYHIKLGIIASDDPHASKILEKKVKYLDYWFSNCKKLNGEKIYYLPTATSSFLPQVSLKDIPEKYKNDIVFVGTVYDNRIKPLEEICQYAEQKNLKVKIIGPLLRTSKDSIIRKYAEEKILENKETKLYYRGSKISINIDRDIQWNATEKEGNSLLIDIGEPYSINPRVYEIAGCRTTQLYINPRQEAIDIFGDNIYYSSYQNIKNVLENIFSEKQNILTNKINNCFNIVIKDHTYIQRSKKLLEILNK
jgi:hypothetical protein